MNPRHDRFLQATMPAADLVFNLARRLTPSAPDAEDLVQETYARAWAAWIDGRRPRKAAPWLATICLNLGRDRLRRTAAHAETTWQAGFDPPGPADVAEEAVNRSTIETALRRLPQEQRIAIVLMDLCGFTAAELLRSDALRLTAWPAPASKNIGSYGWRGTAQRDVGGLPATVYSYADPTGRHILVLSSTREFPRAGQARDLNPAPSWIATVNGASLLCADKNGLSWLAVAADDATALAAGRAFSLS
ncbi:sigma-70 family RNA polymerase sigma factor [Acrocarpospora sp. B8E8]|uniref:RNA polymerase sigma factor n=1 Tax=Acrocarpospora sp. B8E8 TaxID=3153572 RepID=UPI00325DDD45